MLMTAADYRESLRGYRPRVFVNGHASRASPTSRCSRPASPPSASPTISRTRQEHAPVMTARQGTSGKTVNRMLHIDETSRDLLYKLEAVRLVCQDVRLRAALSHP